MKKMTRWFLLSIVFLFIGSLSFLFMPLSSGASSSEYRLPAILNGSVFWISFICGYVALFLAYKQRKKIKGDEPKRRIGALRFFSNTYAKVFDILMIVSLIIMIVLIILGKTNFYFVFVVLALLIFSVNMHCILNGKVMDTIINRESRRENREQSN